MSAKTNVSVRAVTAASFGNALEWYDFSVYAFFAVYISKNFFIQDDPNSALINTFILFGAGFFARPLGALIIGSYGDRVGRKAALTLTILMMAIGVGIIIVTPPYSSIGIWAPICLLIARFFQGFSVGGEIGGTASLLLEYAPENKKIYYASFLQASMAFSNILAALMGIIITGFFTYNEILEYAWRIAFIFGLLIVPVGFYIRKTIDETPEFKEVIGKVEMKKRQPMREVFKHHFGKLIVGVLFSVLWTSCVYTFIIYMPTYYMQLGFKANHVFWVSFIGNVFMVIGCLSFAIFAQRYGKYLALYLSTILMAVMPIIMLYFLVGISSFILLVFTHSVFCIIVSLFAGIAPEALSNYYPTRVRSTGLSLSYNTAAIFFAGFTPAIVTYMLKWSVYAPAFWVMFACACALIAIFFMQKSENR